MKEIVVATRNENKFKEISETINQSRGGIKVRSLSDFGLYTPEETGNTFCENARLKARYCFSKTSIASLGDDSGFCVESLHGFPGICSSRFSEAVGGYQNVFKIIDSCINKKNKNAFFITSLVFVFEENGVIKEEVFEGKLSGKFTYPQRGEHGFGYCPVFVPDGMSQTLSQLPDEVRIKMNHRRIAVEKFVKKLEKYENY